MPRHACRLFGALLSAVLLMVAVPPVANAYEVARPNGTRGIDWNGPFTPQEVAWKRAPTDPRTFDVVLKRSSPPYSQIVALDVDGTMLKTRIHPRKGGFPVGTNFRLQFVESRGSKVLAESNEFSITR